MTKKVKSEVSGEGKVQFPYKNIFLISDIHCGVRSSSEEWQENIRSYFYDWFIPFIKANSDKKTDCIFALGDIYDDRKSINIEVNDMAITIFEKLSKILPVYILNGNHDLYKKTNKGASSLKALENITNVKLFKDPVELTDNGKTIMVIPYLGDSAKETELLMKHKDCDYAFMHTDLTNMRYDNNMLIVGGVNTDSFKGHIYSGHIHKRQTNKNVTYIGAPYQLRRSDIGNQTGIYKLEVETGKTDFFANTFSPIFQKIPISDFYGKTEEEKIAVIKNNYTDILINESDLPKYKIQELYELGDIAKAKRLSIAVNRHNSLQGTAMANEKEKTIKELIDYTIDMLDKDKDKKDKLKALSSEYLNAAEKQLEEEL